jgi:hypothetical protein
VNDSARFCNSALSIGQARHGYPSDDACDCPVEHIVNSRRSYSEQYHLSDTMPRQLSDRQPKTNIRLELPPLEREAIRISRVRSSFEMESKFACVSRLIMNARVNSARESESSNSSKL